MDQHCQSRIDQTTFVHNGLNVFSLSCRVPPHWLVASPGTFSPLLSGMGSRNGLRTYYKEEDDLNTEDVVILKMSGFTPCSILAIFWATFFEDVLPVPSPHNVHCLLCLPAQIKQQRKTLADKQHSPCFLVRMSPFWCVVVQVFRCFWWFRV